MSEPAPTEEGLPQTRLFLVALAIFGSMFTTGMLVIIQNFGWGLFDIVAGLIGLAVLVRDRVNMRLARASITRLTGLKRPLFQTAFLAFALVVISIFVGHTISQIVSVQTAVTRYVLPRTVNEKQMDNLQDYLSHHEAHSVTVKVNPLDGEAIQYAGQIFNALHGTDWTVGLDTSDKEPNTLNSGLCIGEQGVNAKPNDPQHDLERYYSRHFRRRR